MGSILTRARPDQVAVTHVGLDLTVDFASERLVGRALLLVERHDANSPVWLDTRDLEIEAVATARIDEFPRVDETPTLIEVADDPGFVPTTYAVMPTIEPTERSMLRVNTTNVCPTATTAMIAVLVAMRLKNRGVK